MKLERVCTLCYSATGNTARAVDTVGAELAAKLGLPLEQFSFTRPVEREKEYSFTERDLVVVGTPTYAGKMPNKLLPDFQSRLHATGITTSPWRNCARFWRRTDFIPWPPVPL